MVVQKHCQMVDLDGGEIATNSSSAPGYRWEESMVNGAFECRMMAMSPAISTAFLPNRPLSAFPPTRCQSRSKNSSRIGNFQKPLSFTVRAAKLPPGVEMPKVEPKLSAPALGFTRTAEIWNSRAGMIGLIGTFIVELIFHKGILQIIGVDVGKGLDLPL
ncbi:hypothetical protein ACLOJK_030047 [Asimina triloba]